jgi:hypothetical protein
MIQERIRAGLARAKSEGKRLGRPRIAPHSKNESVRLWRLLEGQACARSRSGLGSIPSLSACYRIWKARGRIRDPSPDTSPPQSGLLRADTLASAVGGGGTWDSMMPASTEY